MNKPVLVLLYTLLMRWILRLILGVHYRNKEILSDCNQFILVGNHNSHLDTVALMAALPTHMVVKTRPVAAIDYFGKTGIKRWLTHFFVNALLIPRSRPKEGETGPDPIQMMLDALARGESLILFPEGTRGEAGKLQKFKKGIGLVLAQRPDIPFVPVYFSGIEKLLPKGESVLVPFENYVSFGQPTYCKGLTPEDITARVEAEVLALAPVKAP